MNLQSFTREVGREKVVIYWQRREFRFLDNPALFEAIKYAKKQDLPFCPIFTFDTNILHGVQGSVGYPRRFALFNLLKNWQTVWQEKCVSVSSPFLIFNSPPEKAFENLSKYYDIELFINKDWEPYAQQRDEIVQKLVKNVHEFEDQISIDKDTKTSTGQVYRVFTPFLKRVFDEFLNTKIYSEPDLQDLKFCGLEKVNIDSLDLLKNPENLEKKLFENWHFFIKTEAGEKKIDLKEKIGGQINLQNWSFDEKFWLQKFKKFVKKDLEKYEENRQNLALENGTSKMSMALKWGLVSARVLKEEILNHGGNTQILTGNSGAVKYINELVWREFYKYILYHFPKILDEEYQQKRKNLLWNYSEEAWKNFQKWIVGQTGYDIVDAAMNEIKKTGFMHNRSRMIVASFLTKNLQIDWRWGQEYFRNILIDLDDASNNGGWQWAASTGVDPKPIRIFNPFLQAQNYDKDGVYREKWLGKDWQQKYFTQKELAGLTKNEEQKTEFDFSQNLFLHNNCPQKIIPIVDYKNSREKALKMFGLSKN